MTFLLNGVAPLPHLGVIRVEGEDAARFLQGQLTQDFVLLGMSEARLAGFCSAKGRLQASFVGLKRGENEIFLVCSRDILAATLKRLSMFVLRAKARLTDVTDSFVLLGLAGHAMTAIAGEATAAWTRTDVGTATVVTLYPAVGQSRGLWIAPMGESLPAGPSMEPALWLWGEVRSGVATVTASVVDAFVPQMLNYESVGGVNFKKGCYPGQEVVARSQFRGTLKRRAFIAHANAPLHSGSEVFSDLDPSQPCGLVVQAASSPHGGTDAIVSLQLSLAASGVRLTVGNPSSALLELLPLPYFLLADV